ncbi:MAG TPA: neutral zinc metallopeptidase [Chitinophagaceae bacterium]|jgi:predicted metalloprotease|nr:neutral zinc metallopeptidase [Chitinophagaceae bacterium]
MLWQGREGSSNVDDRRGISGGGLVAGGGVLGVIVLLLNFFLGGGESSQIPQVIQPGGGPQTELSAEERAADDQRAQFVKVVLKDSEDIWNKIMAERGTDYPEPTLVLFRDRVQSGCGGASSQSGPFYCPADSKIYIDLSFYQDLSERFRAPGDFAMAYVITHEVGHHIQNFLGVSNKVARLRQQLSEADYNKYSVMLELQADFYAGVWAHYEKNLKNVVEGGDIEEALNAANAIGDDRLQQESQGRVVPDAFTHGTSKQRMYWFRKGYETGDISQGNTFEAADLQ